MSRGRDDDELPPLDPDLLAFEGAERVREAWRRSRPVKPAVRRREPAPARTHPPAPRPSAPPVDEGDQWAAALADADPPPEPDWEDSA